MKYFPMLFAALLAVPTLAHDLEENRATLVLREQTHLSVSLFLNYPAALHQALQPHRDYGAFLVVFSTLKLEDLQNELNRAQGRFENAIQIQPKGSARPLKLTGWTWPTAAQVRALIQQQMMQAMVDGHVHAPPTEIHAEAVSPQPIVTATAHFPEEFGKMLLVSYRPNQVWTNGKESTPEIRF